LIGAVPVLAGVLVRTDAVRSWAAHETAALVEKEVGTRATYRVEVEPWPLTLALEDIVVDGDDGKGAAVRIERASVRPRIFSLLGGKLDAGEIEVTGAYARLVMRDGKLVSLRPTTPDSTPSEGPARLPFTALAVTDANVDLDVDGTLASVREVDLDVGVETDGAIEIAARAGRGTLTRKHEDPRHLGEDLVDEDRLCKLEARARVEPDQREILIRRLGLAASVDFDPAVGTRPPCDLEEGDWRKVDLRLGAVRVDLSPLPDAPPNVDGSIEITAPAALAHRFASMAHLSGSAHLDVKVASHDGEDLPTVRGRLAVAQIGLDGKVFADQLDAELALEDGSVQLSNLVATWGDGTFHIAKAEAGPLGPLMRLDVSDTLGENVPLEGLLRDLGVHPQAHVGWDIDKVAIAHFGGPLFPMNLQGEIVASTSHFGVYDRPAHRTDKRRMITVDHGDIRGTLAIRPDAAWFENMHLVTPRSDVHATVMLGFKNNFGLEVMRGSRVDLAEVSPIVSVDIAGMTDIEAHGTGSFDVPRIEGTLGVTGFEIGGFKAGDIERAKAVFVPLKLELDDVELKKGQSFVTSPKTNVSFDDGPDVLVDGLVDTTKGSHLSLRDFFEVFHFDQDPRFASISGTAIGTANVHYAIGGTEDRCGGGVLDVQTRMVVDHPSLFGESFERGDADVRFRWDDKDAGSEGMKIEIASATVSEGGGTIAAEATVDYGGVLHGSVVASGLPLSKIEGMGALGPYLDGEAQAVGTFGGTLARPRADVDLTLSPIRLGAEKLPSSRLQIALEPDIVPAEKLGETRCNHPRSGDFNRAEWDKDLPSGQFRINGQLFDGQIRLEDVTVSRQSDKTVRGRVFLSSFDLGTALGGAPAIALGGTAPSGKLSARIDLDKLRPNHLEETHASVDLYDVDVSRGGKSIELVEASGPIVVEGGGVHIPSLQMAVGDQSGLAVGFSGAGDITDFAGTPRVDAKLDIAPFDLSKLKRDISGLERISGTLSSSLEVHGPLASPAVVGAARLRKGSLAIADVPLALDDIEVDVAVSDGEIRVTRATAKVGAGTLDITGRVPIVGLGLGTAVATITARGVKLPVDDGIDIVADADLDATLRPGPRTAQNLPEVHGNLRVTSFAYSRPIALSLDLGELSKTLRKSTAETYDPDGDFLRFDVMVDSPRPLAVSNDLADVRLEIVDPGIRLSGTNQRYGAEGQLRVLPDSKIRLRNHEFEVREGYVRFDDPNKIRPEIDVRATTEYRRYASAESADAGTDSASTTGGNWEIDVHAHGSTDDLKLDLSSDPQLDQEDIVLLLGVGMTRAEIDRGLASSLGETVGLEALSALTGADKAVQSVVPIIDYFHFGSSYSSTTGRTEPNVTVGKRLTDDLRASVTTTLTERDVGATLEWRLKKGVSVQASYDNSNDIGSIIGNLGADLRWRLEFE